MRIFRPGPHAGLGVVAAASIVVASALLLTGCAGSPDPVASVTPKVRASSSASNAAESPATPTAKPTPVTIACDKVLTSEQLTKLMPPLAADAAFTPAKGTAAATAIADAGVACGYTNASTGNPVAVSIAQPTSDDLTALKNAAIRSSHVVPTYGVPPKVMGYFSVDATSGIAQVFTGPYWIVAESKDFREPGDASQVMAGVLGNLPK